VNAGSRLDAADLTALDAILAALGDWLADAGPAAREELRACLKRVITWPWPEDMHVAVIALLTGGGDAARGTCRDWKPVAPSQARQLCPGPLPFRTAPVSGETIASYLARVAAASSLTAGAVAGCLPPWFAAGPPTATISPPPASRGPRTSGTWPRSPGPAKPPCGTRSPRSPPEGARPSARPSPAGAAPPGTGSAARSSSAFPLTSGPASGTGPGPAAPSRSTSPRPRRYPLPAGKRPGSPVSTASPGSCSPRPPPARTAPADRRPGDAPQRSRSPAPGSIPNTPTRPRLRPIPRQSTSRRPCSALRARCPEGRNNRQNPAHPAGRIRCHA
jgi:hypothetical protein